MDGSPQHENRRQRERRPADDPSAAAATATAGTVALVSGVDDDTMYEYDDQDIANEDLEPRRSVDPSGLSDQESDVEQSMPQPQAFHEGRTFLDNDSTIITLSSTTAASETPHEQDQPPLGLLSTESTPNIPLSSQRQPDENQSMTATESLVQAEMIEEEPEQEIPLAAAKPLVETDAQNCWARRRNRYIVVAVLCVVVIAVVVFALVVTFRSGGSENEASNDSLTPPDWVQVGQILVGEGAGDLSGKSVAISADGTVLAIGAPWNDRNGFGAGHVRVWQQTGGTWTRLGQDLEGMSSGDGCGYSISLSADGTVLAIGEPFWSNSAGRVRVWRLVDSTWSQLGPSIEFERPFGLPRLGDSVSLSADGNVLAIGSPGNMGNIISPVVSVWQRTLENWTQLGQDITTESPASSFDLPVSLSANGTLLASGPFKSGYGYNSARYVRVWQLTEGKYWDPLGQDVYVENPSDIAFKYTSVALSSADGTAVLAIGEPEAGENGTLAGYVRVWRRMEGMTRGPANWTQLGQDIEGKGEKDYFGRSLALSKDGKILAIGAAARGYFYTSTDADASDYVRVFQWMESEWVPLGSHLEGKGEYDLFGNSVALSSDGKVLAVGAIQDDEESSRPGYVRVFQLQ